jgi:hypothetical protein
MFPQEARQIHIHLTEAIRQLESVEADYPEQGWVLFYLIEDVQTIRQRINEILQS